MRKNVGSPLSNRVNSRFGGSVNHRSKKIIAGFLIATIGPLGATTLAASVTLNSGNSFEFGQGSNLTIACDTSITTALAETWVNASAYFKVSTITLGGINNAVAGAGAATDSGCGNKLIKVSLLDSNGAPIIIGSSSATSVTVSVPTGTGTCVAGTGTEVLNGATHTADTCASATTAAVIITINPSTVSNATGVFRIAIESA
jgi:hypothetical protein